jgi:GT2 family glycosyltransferase/2-polyprenyl-3-methyl-5-hydroxy-6-metoxy-1,4-benzoquinol methylase
MKKRALVCMLWGHNLAALVHYLGARPSVILAPSSHVAIFHMKELLAEAGGDVQALDGFLDHSVLESARAKTERLGDRFIELVDRPEWADFSDAHDLDAEGFARIVANNLLARLEEQVVMVEALDRAAAQYDIELIVVNEDFTRLPRAIIEWGKARGIPSVHVSHGLGLSLPYTVHSTAAADYATVFGERDVENFLAKGLDREHVIVTGNPAMDEYSRAASRRPGVREALSSRYPLGGRPTIVYGTTWMAWLTAFDTRARFEDGVRAFLRAAKTLRDAGRDWNFVVKDRVSNAGQGDVWTARIAEEEGMSDGDYLYATDAAMDWILVADALVATDSNMLIEAMHLGIPAINILNEFGLVMGPSFDAESGVLEVEPDALADTLSRVIEDARLREALADAMRKHLPEYNAGLDGLAAQRVAAVMLKALGSEKAIAGAREADTQGKKPPQEQDKHYVWHSLGGTAGAREEHEFYPDVPRKEVVSQFARTPRRVLEIGCATGATAAHLKTLYPCVWVAGIEMSEAAASVARERMDQVIVGKFEDADLEGQGIVPGSIDTVIVADVLEHMYDPWSVLVRLKPYLTPDAQVIASIPNARNLWLMNELANGRFPYAPVGLLDITHIRFFTRIEIEKLFAETGYAIESWARTPDGRLMNLQLPPGATAVETEKLVIKGLTPEEFEDIKCLQFVVRARPLAEYEAMLPVPAARRARSGPYRLAIYSRDVKTSACPQIRFLRPFHPLGQTCELLWAVAERPDGGWTADLSLEADAYVITRLFPGPDAQADIDALFAKGKPVIYETDDLLLDLPADNPHAREYADFVPFIEAVAKRADAVVVSTAGLAARLSRYNANIHLLPNLVDYALFQRSPPDNGRQINIGVVGTSARSGDFTLIDAALRAICKEYGKRIRIKFVGALPEGWKDHPNAEFIPFVADYGGYAARMKGLDLDIGLAPLADNPFNACKSPIKWLEFSALGAAGIYSAVPAYTGALEQGKTGLLVDNVTEKWVNAIKLLIDYPEFRLELALAAQLKVYQEHSLQRQGQRVAGLYGRLIDNLAGPGAEPVGAVSKAAAPNQDAAADFYTLWQMGHGYREADLRWYAERMSAWSDPARVHIGVICRAGHESALSDNIKSLTRQFHKGWRLTIVAEIPAPGELLELPQIAWVQAPADLAIARLNEVLVASEEGWVGMIEAGDRLALHATFAIADALSRHAEWRLIYSDEDRVTEDGTRHTPFFKPDFNLDMLRAAPFSLGGLMLLERSLFAELGGFRPEAEGLESWDLALRASERMTDAQIGHLADVLYHRSEAGGHNRREAEEAWESARAGLEAHLQRMDLPAEIEDGLLPGSFRIRYRIRGTPLVSIIVPTKNQVDLLRTCLTSLIEGTRYSHCEVLVVDNGSDDPETLAYLQSLRDLNADSLKVLSWPGVFNFSAMNNMAARVARGEYLLLLNNDTQVLHEDWLQEMLGYAQRPDVGAVGARLLYPDGTIQHAGAILGLGGMGSNHVYQHAAADEVGYFGRLQLPQDYSALTAACLLTRKAHYEAVGGLDEEAFQVNFNDVDYCLKLRARGLKVVWTPHATLRHEESVSQVAPDVERIAAEEKYKRLYREVEAVVAKWAHWFANDPAYNRNLSLMLPFQPEPTPALAWDPEWRPAPRVLSIHADTMGCGEYRIIAPMRALSGAGKVMGWDAGGYFHPREYARMDPDSIVFQRQLEWGQIEFMQRISRISKAFRVYELDDLITNIPIMSSQKKLFVEQKDVNKRFRKAVGLCHRFVVSTDYLAEAFKGYCDEIVVVPNYLERARWDGFTPKRRGGDRPRVGWAGSATHAGDLRLIIDVVSATAEEVDWIFFGMCPDPIRPLVKEFHEPVKLEDYAVKLASLDLDLAIAPLEDIPFNHGKSHLRLLEYGVMGYPVVCSDITPYRGNYPVTRVPAKFKSWVEAIRDQVADRDALARRGDALRESIQRDWMLEDHLDVWLKAWLPGR